MALILNVMMNVMKSTKQITIIAALLLATSALLGCEKENNGNKLDSPREVKITVCPPTTIGKSTLISLDAVMERDGMKEDCTVSGNVISARLTPGRYALSLKASYHAEVSAVPIVVDYDGTVDVDAEENVAEFDAQLIYAPQDDHRGLLIREIFYTGTLDAHGKQYDDDKYIIISNSSLTTPQKLDGLVFIRSGHMTDLRYEAKPMPDLDNFLLIDIAYQFPGSGNDHVVKPGGSVIICQSAINHRESNPNSADLTIADFEWEDSKSAYEHDMPNNPAVPDMLPLYIYDSNSDFGWAMNTNGGHGYALIRPQWDDASSYLKNPKNTQRWTFTIAGIQGKIPGDPYIKIPNGWIVDFVATGLKDDIEWSIVSPLIDAGVACVVNDINSDARYSLSVQRKRTANGVSWEDTNNSTNDFEAKKGSLLP